MSMICGPKGWRTILGRRGLRKSLDIFIRAAKGRGEPLDHVRSMVSPVLVKLPSLILLPMKWMPGLR